MILFHSVNGFRLQNKLLYKRWLKELAGLEGCRVGDINYIFCDDEYLIEINRRYLHHDTFTDIITFDYVEGKVLSGDIYVSTERVCENARIFQVSFEDEFSRVLAHGVFHLCGYEDKTEEEASLMRLKEDGAILLFRRIRESCN